MAQPDTARRARTVNKMHRQPGNEGLRGDGLLEILADMMRRAEQENEEEREDEGERLEVKQGGSSREIVEKQEWRNVLKNHWGRKC